MLPKESGRYMKINSKFTRLKCKTWNHKLLKGNKGIITPWHGSWQGFLDMTPKSQAPKPKMNKRDYLKPKSFFTAKEAIKKMIRQPLKWEKIFTNNIWYRVDTQNIQRTQKKKKKANNYIEKIVKRPGGIGIFPKKIYKWQIGIWKYVQPY